MRIGLFTDTYFPQVSGVATSIKTLKDELVALGHDVFIFTTTDPKADPNERNIIRLGSIPFVSFKDRRVVVRGMVAAYEKAKDYQLDIVHTHTEFGVGWLGKYIGRQLGIPVLHTYHTMYEDYLHYIAHGKLIRPWHVRQISRTFCRNLSGLVCPSQRVVETLKAYQIATPMAVIPTGVNLAKFAQVAAVAFDRSAFREELGCRGRDIMLLSLSRLSYEKNIQALIAGLPAVVAAEPRVKLVIVGGGPFRRSLAELAEQLGVMDHVYFVGEVDNQEVSRYYQAADYFVSASASESQGLTYIEALAAGTQLIVKGNEYLASLVDDPALGTTYESDQDFAASLLAYLAAAVPGDERILAQKLAAISSASFGAKVNAFYEDAQVYYDVFIAPKKHSPAYFPKRFFKRH